MKEHTSFRIGGQAKYFLEVKTAEDLKEALFECRRLGVPHFILGGGTNVLVSDEGFRGAVIKMANSRFEFLAGGRVKAEAGVAMPDLVAEAARRGLAGLEWAGGLPGSVGGAIRGNAGCFGGEIKDILESVECLEPGSGSGPPSILVLSARECGFGYRSSVFKKNNAVILSAIFKLRPGADPTELERQIAAHIRYRAERQPLEYPNAGSVFKNCDAAKVAAKVRERFSASIKIDPFPVIPTAKILVAAGLKGERRGDAEFSVKHPNFIVNLGSASAEDVKNLIAEAKNRVENTFSLRLEEEIQIL